MITKEQEQYILDNYKSVRLEDIGKELGLHKNTVSYYLKKNGISKREPLLNDEQAKYVLENYISKTYSEVGEKVGLTSKQVEGWLRNHAIDKKNKRRSFNARYFKNIETPNQAYWLGFIYADGWISKSNNSSWELGIELKRDDEYMLQLLNEELGCAHKIYRSAKKLVIAGNAKESTVQTSILRIYSKQIVDDLNNNGIEFKKTYKQTFPVVDDSIFPDFLRGYIDGDGCIHRMGKNLAVHITSANKSVLEYIQQKLNTLYNITTSIYEEHIDGYAIKYRLYCFRKSDVKKLLDILYYNENVPKLMRKYKIYENYYGLTA